MTIRQFVCALALFVSLLLSTVSAARAEIAPPQLWYISFAGQADLQQLVRDVDVWEVDHANRRVLAALTAADAEALAATHTLQIAPDQTPLASAPATAAQQGGIAGYPCYRTVDETFATLDTLAAAYPTLVQHVDIGDSWDKGRTGAPPGDDLRVVVLTNQNVAVPKFRFFLMGAIHAREYATSELALRFAESLLQGYGTDADATWLLDHGELHVLAVVNPDGRRIAEGGQLWRKNTNTDAACAYVSLPSNSYGVDLNRNSSFQWNACDGFSCSSADSCRETYRGDAPASEPEVDAIESYLRAIFPDERADDLLAPSPMDRSGVFISLHSYGRLVLFPWGWTSSHAPNAYGLATLARRIGYPLGYTVCQAGGFGCLYQTDGTTDDYVYGELGVAGYTIELGTSFFQSCSYFEESILQQGMAALRYAFKAAPRPFVLAEGPEVVAMSVSPDSVSAAGTAASVTISATIDASRIAFLSGSGVTSITEPVDRVHQARVTVDTLPWATDAVPVALSAVDGAFNTVLETASAALDLACLPDGRHTLFVQGQDEAKDWGVVAARFVTVTNTSPFTVSVAPALAETSVSGALTYTVMLTNTSVVTTGFDLEVQSEAAYVVEPPQIVSLGPGRAHTYTVVITPQNVTVDTIMPTVMIVRDVDEPTRCRQVSVTGKVAARAYRQRLLIIGKH